MLTEIHSNRERWYAVRPLMSRKPLSAFQLAEQQREPEFELLKFDQVIQRVNDSGVVPDRFYANLDESRGETIGAYDPKARISQKRELSIGQNKIKSAMDAIIPADPKGDRFRESLGEYVFMNRHEIAEGAFLREILADANNKHPSRLANKPVIDRHVEQAQQILFDEWEFQKNQIGRLQPHQTEKHLNVPENPLRELARGFIRYERGLGFVMPNDHKAEFEKLPNEKRIEVPGLQDPALRQASLDWAAKAKQAELTSNSRPYMRSDVYPTDQAAPEFLEQRWLRTDAFTLDNAGEPRSARAAAFDLKTGIRPDRQEHFIRVFAPRPVVTGWTKQGTLEVAIHDRGTNKTNYNYINQLELLSPTDIHSDGRGGLKLVPRTKRIVSQSELDDGFEMPPVQKDLHPVLKDLISPTLAANQPEHDFIFRDRRMNRTLSDLKNKSATVLEEMDWDQEVSAGLIRKTRSVETPQRNGGSKTSQHGLTETIKLTKFLNTNLRRHAKERGVDFQEVDLEDVVFTARVLEAKKAGLEHPSLDDWSKEEVQLAPNVFAATNYKPAFSSESSAKDAVGQPVREALAEARKKVPAGAKFLFETKEGAEALDQARKTMAEEYAPTKTAEQFSETLKRNFEVVSKADSTLGDAVKRRGKIEKEFRSLHSNASQIPPQAIEHSPQGASELAEDSNVADVDEIQPVIKHAGTSRKRTREVANSSTDVNRAEETPRATSRSNVAAKDVTVPALQQARQEHAVASGNSADQPPAKRVRTSETGDPAASDAAGQAQSNPKRQPQNDERDVLHPVQTPDLQKSTQTTTRLTPGRSAHIPDRAVTSGAPSGPGNTLAPEPLKSDRPLPIPSDTVAAEAKQAGPKVVGASGNSSQRPVSLSSAPTPGNAPRQQSEDGAILLPLVQSVLNGDNSPGRFSREVSKRATSVLMEGFQKALEGSEAEQRSLSDQLQAILRDGDGTARPNKEPHLSAADFRNSAEYIRAFLQDAVVTSASPQRPTSGNASDANLLQVGNKPNATEQRYDQPDASRKRRRVSSADPENLIAPSDRPSNVGPSSAAAPSELQSDRPRAKLARQAELQTSAAAEIVIDVDAEVVIDVDADRSIQNSRRRAKPVEVIDLDGGDHKLSAGSSALPTMGRNRPVATSNVRPPAAASTHLQDPVRRLGQMSETSAAQALPSIQTGGSEAATSDPRAPIKNRQRDPQGRK